ncbi:MAG: DUF1573 domain-containing protein [Saprospiraceae bacterium]|nr:DUF1573 domain-containing protein [Saprospiraceae bacterium]MCB0542487.1 DUF1573 domain-containing protein [Saprospiraceae bacterium]MCB0577535.1 DUF1573 domain-containing protein [Saprospiraceae bacterium]MCB9307566.1 DUF1573 domain-containing protein [Lewinellaceae bacterium]MCB9356529.1 DUF1573 domain-containing protein [Lewinellaceae bacterium]
MLWLALYLNTFFQFPLMPAHATGDAEPVVTWLTEQDHDFGEVAARRPVSFTFRFRNVSRDTILLQTVRTTCGCTAARYTEEPLAPDAEGEVNIEYDALQGGAFRKKIRVFFDRQRKPEILWIEGEVDR